MKPKYEKPIAMPLGETVKGSGQCNAGSGVMPGATASYCAYGPCPECLAGSSKSVSDECHGGGGGWDWDDE
jgi:hypothetical protein